MTANRVEALFEHAGKHQWLRERGWPEWAVILLTHQLMTEDAMADLTQAELDLALAVKECGVRVSEQLQALRDALAAGDTATAQAAADAIEAQVTALGQIAPTPTAPAAEPQPDQAPPADVPPSDVPAETPANPNLPGDVPPADAAPATDAPPA